MRRRIGAESLPARSAARSGPSERAREFGYPPTNPMPGRATPCYPPTGRRRAPSVRTRGRARGDGSTKRARGLNPDPAAGHRRFPGAEGGGGRGRRVPALHARRGSVAKGRRPRKPVDADGRYLHHRPPARSTARWASGRRPRGLGRFGRSNLRRHTAVSARAHLSLERETIPWEDGGGGRGGAGNPEGRTRPPRERSEGSAARAGRALRTVGLTDRRPGASGGGASGRRPPGIRPLWTVGSPPAPGSPTPQSGSSPVPGGRRAPQRRHREGRQRAGEGRRPKTPGSRSHRRSQSGRRQGISRDERPPPSPERGEERRDEAGGAETPGRSAEGDRPERRARSRDRPREGTAPRLPRAKGDGKANGSEPSERGSALPSAPGPRESEREREIGVGDAGTLGPLALPTVATWLILPVVICLSQRLSHACLSTSSEERNCGWLIKSVVVPWSASPTRITVVIPELIHAPKAPTSRKACSY